MIQFPDVSSYQAGLNLSGATACIAKASEGTGFVDHSYSNFKGQAAALGIPFCAYHWLHAGNVQAQAALAYNIVGPNTPLMIDDEDTNDGLDVNRTLAFVSAYRALGGTVTLEYLPHWFWQGHGAPDLTPLVQAGLSLVSSSYLNAPTENGVGWDSYGGMTPQIWQWTSSFPWQGQRIDMNAFKGTQDQLRALFTGKQPAPPAVEDEMLFLAQESNIGPYYLCNGMTCRGPLTRPPGSGQIGPVGPDEIADLKTLHAEGIIELWHGGEIRDGMTAAFGLKIPWADNDAPGNGVSAEDVREIVREELDLTKLTRAK